MTMWTDEEEKMLRDLRIDPVKMGRKRLRSLTKHFEANRSVWAVINGGAEATATRELANKVRDATRARRLTWVSDESERLPVSAAECADTVHDTERLEKILAAIWIPEPDDIVYDPLGHGIGVYEVRIGSRPFRWETGDDGFFLIWVDRRSDLWFTREFLPSLAEEARRELAEMSASLGQQGGEYVQKCIDYSFRRLTGNGIWAVSDVAYAQLQGIGFMDVDWFPEAQDLIVRHQRLSGLATQFKERLRDAGPVRLDG